MYELLNPHGKTTKEIELLNKKQVIFMSAKNLSTLPCSLINGGVTLSDFYNDLDLYIAQSDISVTSTCNDASISIAIAFLDIVTSEVVSLQSESCISYLSYLRCRTPPARRDVKVGS